MGCSSSKTQGASPFPSGRVSGPRPTFANGSWHKELGAQLSSLAPPLPGVHRLHSVNLSGRQSIGGQSATFEHRFSGALPPLQEGADGKQVPASFSSPAVPGTRLAWTPSRVFLEDSLQHANSNPAPPGDTDHHRLQQRLAELRLDGIEMRGDGNCQFRAISWNLYGTEDHHMLVRRKVVDYMRRHQQQFAPFLGEDCGRYLQDMAVSGTWGDELTLRACCDTYGVMVNTITSDEQHWFMRYTPKKGGMKKYRGSNREIFLTYVSPVHYNAIRRRISHPDPGLSSQSSSNYTSPPRTQLQPTIPETLAEDPGPFAGSQQQQQQGGGGNQYGMQYGGNYQQMPQQNGSYYQQTPMHNAGENFQGPVPPQIQPAASPFAAVQQGPAPLEALI